MRSDGGYKLVRLGGGIYSIHAAEFGETFHPVIGPAAEAEALYVRQLRLADRWRAHVGEFVFWDVGLGGAANPVTVLKALRGIPGTLRILSFDRTTEALRFALDHAEALGYLAGFEQQLETLLRERHVAWRQTAQQIHWELILGDFPALLNDRTAETWPKPHAIFFDAFSPSTNPEMWTQPLFAAIFKRLDPRGPCALPTYSRSTMLRVTLLTAGFYVGIGHATGEKEETTIAANTLELIENPLGRAWLHRARRSTSAEPMWAPHYRQARLTAETWEKLVDHPQFR